MLVNIFYSPAFVVVFVVSVGVSTIGAIVGVTLTDVDTTGVVFVVSTGVDTTGVVVTVVGTTLVVVLLAGVDAIGVGAAASLATFAASFAAACFAVNGRSSFNRAALPVKPRR